MGPSHPEQKSDDSSDSDEETNVRHDRFRSERFNENTSRSFRPKDEKHSYDERSRSRRHRERSPRRTHRLRETLPSSSYKSGSKSNHDRKDRNESHHSKSSKSDDIRRTVHDKKYLDKNYTEEKVEPKSSINKLSSLLKNFDKQIESKRKITESHGEIGPALPPRLQQKFEEEEVSPVESSHFLDESVGPGLPPYSRHPDENRNEDSSTSSTKQAVTGERTCYSVKELSNADTERNEETTSVRHIVEEGLNSPIKDAQTGKEGKATEIQKHIITDRESTLSSSSSLEAATKEDVLDNESFGPVLPPKEEAELYGPALPPKVEADSYGPALPPNFKKDVILGPSLPVGIGTEQLELAQEESEDEDMVGPLPKGKMNMTQYQLDLRATHIKRKLEEEKSGSSTDIKKREEWMLELPPEKASNLGLGPRSFRMREAPDMSDRSSWTDTPADKIRKEEQALRGEVEPVNQEEMMKKAFIRERDQIMDNMSQLIKDEDKPQSLLEMHQKKLKKKKKKEEKEGKKKERRPFDRNIDLQVHRFDEAQKKAIFKKAQLLDTRFSSGESKYL